ncbi:hypothetical protein [Mycobacterium sp. 1245805.9]|uniref:hypothetical protein n=1 Tax=Mycobacterium sp. 1245805.9 TaxID=1856862 RepID=UPI0008006DF5|nr:hypothetical protein [Mycobacterium sp. 1245805.9]OBI81076.1 hypothetical protein A9X00_09760 [Mycobacterium sp. 1245805.9]
MRHITTTFGGHHGTRDLEAAAFWIFGAIILLIAFGDAVAVLAAAVAVVASIAWIYRKIERLWDRDKAHPAPVTHLRPEWADGYDAKEAPAQALSHHPHAA